MSWLDKRVLVTGAGGFIGSHLTERLIQEGARVRALLRYNSSGALGWLDQSIHLKDIEVFAGDVRDQDSVLLAMKNIDVVFHLAALIAIPYSYNAPASYVATNITGTLNVLQAARAYNTERIVHTSTSEVYGSARKVPIDEMHPIQGQSPYSASKIGADKIAESFHLSFDLPVVTVRPFNTFGPRQSARAIIPTIIMQALTRDTVCLGSLDPTRDLNYVSNTVDGFLLAGMCQGVLGDVVNLGSGREISMGDLADLIIQIVGRPAKVVSDVHRMRPEKSEVLRLVADNRHAKKVLGWRPEISLEEGLEKTVQWIKANIAGFRIDEYAI